MLLNVITTYLFLGAAVGHLVVPRSEVNGPCTGSGGAPGVCIATADCTKGGGSFVSNKCPGTPEDIKCCTKTACGTDNKGICRFVSSCASGNTETNKCSGPTDFRCCMPGSGNGNYPPPGLPTTSQGCKQTAIDGAKKIVSAFPGKIIEIGCKRNCADPSSSDHCTGMANDLMVAKYGVSRLPVSATVVQQIDVYSPRQMLGSPSPSGS